MPAVTNSIVIVNCNSKDSLQAMLAALALEQSPTTEAIVIDNASFDGSAEMVRERFPHVRVISLDANRGFARAANKGLAEAQGDVVVLCHSDLIADVHVLTEMADRVREGKARRIAMLAPRLIGPDRRERPVAGTYPTLSRAILDMVSPNPSRGLFVPRLEHANDDEWVVGACVAIDLEVFSTVGGFDEGFFLYYAEADLCQRLHERSYRIVFAPRLSVVHGKDVVGASGAGIDRGRLLRRDEMRFFKKHRPNWQQAVLAAAVKVSSWTGRA